jgi:hypothetical protein
MNTTTKTQVVVDDQEMEVIFREVENQVPVPFVSVTLNTDFTSMVKKSKVDGTINPYYKELKKTQTKTYRLVTDYEKRVHNNLIKEGKNPNDFVVSSPSGKVHISKSILKGVKPETENNRYVMIEWFKEIKGSEPTYNHNGNEVDKRMFEKWLTDYNSSNEKQGLEREVKPITPLFQSIVSFRVNGTEYIRKVD